MSDDRDLTALRRMWGQVSGLISRDRLATKAQQYSGARKLYEVLGYDQTLNFEDYYEKYDRGGLAGAIIDKPIDTTWREQPVVTDDQESEEDTPFEEAVEFLFDEYRLLHYLKRVDKAAALGRFGVLYLGFQDGMEQDELGQPVADGQLSELDPDASYSPERPPPLTHFGVHTEDSIKDDPLLETDPTSPRHNLPVKYDIDFGDARGTTGTQNRHEVHWTRVVHVAGDLLESEWEGRPTLKRIYNRLEDWDKVVGGVAEVAWRSADRKLVFDVDPEMGDIPDEEDLSDQVDELAHDLRSYLQTRGMDVQAIEGEVQDPQGITGVLKEEISADRDIPQRILTGSERGELASSQDEANFLGKVSERQDQFAEPAILRPLLDRLIQLGVLPQPEGGSYTVEWPNLFELNELEEAQMTNANAQALKRASPMGDPGTLLDDKRILLWLRGDYEAVIDWVEDQPDDLPGEVPEDAPPGEEEGGPPPEDTGDEPEEPPEDAPESDQGTFLVDADD